MMTDTGPPSLVGYEDEDDEEVVTHAVEEGTNDDPEVVVPTPIDSVPSSAQKLPTNLVAMSLSSLNAVETSSVDQISDDEGDGPSLRNSPAGASMEKRKTAAVAATKTRKRPKFENKPSLVSYDYGDDEDDDDFNNADDDDEEDDEEEEEEMEEAGGSEVSGSASRAPGGPSGDNSGARSPRRPSPSDNVGSTEEDELADAAMATANRSSLDQDLATSLSRSVQNLAPNEIEIPPAPTGRCSFSLIQKIQDTKEKMKMDPNFDINIAIQGNKGFRNPSIYDKIVDFLGIDEKGTNYPPEMYNPYVFGKESFYDELAKAQKAEVDRREKERKERGKVEFVADSSKKPPEVRKRSKWDMSPGKKSAQPKTQIPAVGNIMKKK